jgi:hypothetical protein
MNQDKKCLPPAPTGWLVYKIQRLRTPFLKCIFLLKNASNEHNEFFGGRIYSLTLRFGN